MYQECVEVGEILTSQTKSDTYTDTTISSLVITTMDYGVPEVGIDLVAAWIEQLYKHCEGFIIDAVIVHPKTNPPAKGAIIQWDYVNDCPIVRVISN